MGKKLNKSILLKKNGELQNISYQYSAQVTDDKKNLPSRAVSNINNFSKLFLILVSQYFIQYWAYEIDISTYLMPICQP